MSNDRLKPTQLSDNDLASSAFARLLGLRNRLEILDIGAACITETPIYRSLLNSGIAHLHAFEGDPRQIAKIITTYGNKVTVHPDFLFDGTEQTVYIAHEASGMTSLLKPNQRALKFFNGFEQFGSIQRTQKVRTERLDEVQKIGSIDFLKMDVQGAELTVLKHGLRALERCVAIQLEVSFIALYESQPTFGEVDVWLRSNGFTPHCFLDLKRWSIAPTVRNNNFREPFNQVLEADIVYVRDPLHLSVLDEEQLKTLALISHECLGSADLTVYLLLELDKRRGFNHGAKLHEQFFGLMSGKTSA